MAPQPGTAPVVSPVGKNPQMPTCHPTLGVFMKYPAGARAALFPDQPAVAEVRPGSAVVCPPPPPAEASSTLGHRPEFLVLGSAAGGGRQLRSPAEAQRHTKDPSYRSSFSPPKQFQGPVLRSASSPHPSQKHFSPFLPTCSNAPRL